LQRDELRAGLLDGEPALSAEARARPDL